MAQSAPGVQLARLAQSAPGAQLARLGDKVGTVEDREGDREAGTEADRVASDDSHYSCIQYQPYFRGLTAFSHNRQNYSYMTYESHLIQILIVEHYII